MKFVITIFAAALLPILPACAQPAGNQPHPAMHAPAMHPPAMHPTVMHAPAMHAPAPAMHPGFAHHTAGYHRVGMHHVVHHRHHHHHAVVHAGHVVQPAVRMTSRPGVRRAPAAVVAKLRKNVVAAHRFHAGPYRAPAGWHYRHWVFGERLPAIYFAPAYWITDFLAFDLFPPPDGYVWVRYGPDALLIDEYTGEIIQVVYDVFY